MITVGIDEVGRGAWAGPLVAAAVILHKPIAGLADSKLITKIERERLDPLIKANADWGIGWVAPAEVDSRGLTDAVRLAMQRALDQITPMYDEIIIDGNYNFLADNPVSTTFIKADLLIPAVSAASIIAKVARDNLMEKMDVRFPGYGFVTNVGYGTKLHTFGLQTSGICELHRVSYTPIKKFM